MFEERMKKYNFHLVSPNFKSTSKGKSVKKLHKISDELFNDHTIKDGLGSFEQIIEKIEKLSPDIIESGAKKAIEMITQKNDKLRLLSSLNNWFIFQKG